MNSPSPASSAAARTTEQPSGPSTSTPTPTPTSPPRATPDARHNTYPDGIPRQVADEVVYRVEEALSFGPGRTLLIGGWHLQRECLARRPRNCSSPTLADVRLDSPRTGDLSTHWIALDGPLTGSGARILRGTLEEDPRCSIRVAGECQLRLSLLSIVWTPSPGGWHLT